MRMRPWNAAGRWAGLTLTLAILVVAVASRWCSFGFSVGRWEAGFFNGRLWTEWQRHDSLPSRVYARYVRDPSYEWRFEEYSGDGVALGLVIPGWFLLLATGAPTLFLWRRAPHWRTPGVCSACGYSKAGLHADAACPECGAG